VTVGEAARLLGISKRQVRGFGRATRREGASTLAHGNRGRRPANAVASEVGKQVIELATTTSQGFNRHHFNFTEMLAEREEIPVSSATVDR
jgi:transposase